MPADFERCVKGGGRVRTKKLKDGKYMHICYDKSGSHAGEVKHAKSSTPSHNENKPHEVRHKW